MRVLPALLICLLFLCATVSTRAGNNPVLPGTGSTFLNYPNTPGCVAAFTDSVSGLTAYFTNNSTGGDINTVYSWNFGDGGSASHVVNPMHRYSNSGTYTVCLVTRNTVYSCWDSVCQQVTVTQCQASFDTTVVGNKLIVKSTSTGVDLNTHYQWTFGDGGIGTLDSQGHTYTSAVLLCSVPVILTNTQADTTPANFQQMIVVNSSSYTLHEHSDLSNVEFTTAPNGGGAPLQAWIESGNSSTSTNTVYWVNLANNIIPANGSLTIYMNFMPSSVLSATGPTGEASQLSATYGQYDNGALVFPDCYTAWGGLSNSSLPGTISAVGDVGVTNYPTFTQIYFEDYYSTDGVYFTNNPNSVNNFPTVLESYYNNTGYYSWFGTGNGFEEGGTGVTIDYDYPGFSATDFGIKSNGGNEAYITNQALTDSPVIWSMLLADQNTLTSVLSNYTNVLSGPNYVEAGSPQYYGYFGTQQNGGNNTMNIYWTRTRTYPPSGVMPSASTGTSVGCAQRGAYTVCLTISNGATGCNSQTCQNVVIGPVSDCQASFDTVVTGNTLTVTSTSTNVDANTTYTYDFGDGSTGHQANMSHKYQNPINVCSVPVLITNNQNTATPANFAQMVVINSSSFASSGEDANLDNVEFTTSAQAGGTVLQAWIESGNTSSSTGTVYWVNLGNTSVPANGSTTIYMNFMPAPVLSAGGPTGEAPQLSATYAQYDNGANVFTPYYTNFVGTSLPASLTQISGSSTVNNGLTNLTGNYDNVASNASFDFTQNTLEAYGADNWPQGSDANDRYLTWSASPYGGPAIYVDGGYYLHNYDGGSDYYTPIITSGVTGNNTWSIYSNNGTGTASYNYNTTATSTNNMPGGNMFNFQLQNSNSYTSFYQYVRIRPTPPNGVMPTTAAGNVTCAPVDNFTVCLTISNNQTGCSSSSCENVYVVPAPPCVASFDTAVTLNRLVVHSTSTGVDDNTQYHWSFGDDSIGTIDSQAHIYSQPGTYYVCLNIRNTATGCSSQACDSVVIKSFVTTCSAAFSDSIDDLKGYFTNKSTGTTDSTHYSWNFGDGTAASHVQDPIHLYADTGTYLVCLVISNYTQECFDSICKLISIKQCHASFKDTGVSITGLLTVVSTSTGVDANTKYHWTFGDDSIGTLDSQAHTYHTPGKYLVCLTITNSVTGCQSTACDTIVYTLPNSECTADFAWQDEYGYGIQFRNESKDTTPNTQLTWNMGDGTVLKGQHEPEHRYAHSGTYIVCLNIVDSTETYCNSTFCDTINFVHTGIDQLSFVGSSLYYDANNSQVVLNWVGNDKATINLVDILGREEQQIYAGNLNTGTYRFNVNSSFIATGIYFVRIVANDGSRAWKIFILPH